MTEEYNDDEVHLYQSVVGILIWLCKIRIIDILAQNFANFDVPIGVTCWASTPSITCIQISEGLQAFQIFI